MFTECSQAIYPSMSLHELSRVILKYSYEENRRPAFLRQGNQDTRGFTDLAKSHN